MQLIHHDVHKYSGAVGERTLNPGLGNRLGNFICVLFELKLIENFMLLKGENKV